jgi:transposase-like protein
MERRKNQSREEWNRIVSAQERSGQSIPEFCRQESICISSFYQWKRRLADGPKRDGEIGEKSFIDIGRVGDLEKHKVKMPQMPPDAIEVTLELGFGTRLILRRS